MVRNLGGRSWRFPDTPEKLPLIRKVIPVDCPIPPELNAMLLDFQDMVNWLISWGLYNRVHNDWEMQAQNYTWFREKYYGKYAAHYLQSACGVASELLRSWVRNGGDTSRRPYIRHPFARLDQRLVKIELLDKYGVKLRITVAPRQWVYMEIPVHHKRWNEYSQYKLGELTIVPNGVRLLFQMPDTRVITDMVAGVDLNLNRVVIATNDGKIEEMSISRATEIQESHREKRQKIQKRLPKNLQKRNGLLGKHRGRERHRVEDLLYEYRREFFSILEDRFTYYEDLSSTTMECLKDAKGKRFRAKLSSWIHGRFQNIMALASPYQSEWVYARGSSSYCPFCGSELKHPTWRISRCHKCGYDYDRDWLSSVCILVRGLAHYKRGVPQPLAKDYLEPRVVSLLLEQCIVKVLRLMDEGKPGGASASPGLWEVPASPLFEAGGPFIPNAFPSAPDGQAPSASVPPRQGQGLRTAVRPVTGYGMNTGEMAI